MGPDVARALWHLLEPYHAVVYFAPETKQRYGDAGLKGYWMGYFASRAAAMGAPPAELVIATFYNFHPAMVRRAIPDAWRFSTPERVLAARYAVADDALRRLLGDGIASQAVADAAAIARAAADAADPAGRPLFAAHASLPWPEDPHLTLWHAATLLREHRGDGHVATLVAEGIDGCEAHVLMAARGAVDAATQPGHRGWSEDEWRAAAERLAGRGLLDADGTLTERGAALRESIEERTDRLALGPYRALGDDRVGALRGLLRALAAPIVAADGVPYPNPMGLPRSSDL